MQGVELEVWVEKIPLKAYNHPKALSSASILQSRKAPKTKRTRTLQKSWRFSESKPATPLPKSPPFT
jgi:hypothetical protein